MSEKSDFSEKVSEMKTTKTKPQNVEQYSVDNMIRKTLKVYGL